MVWVGLPEFCDGLANAPLPLGNDRNGRILVMDDEPEVRDVLCSILRRLGHETESAACAGEAIEKCMRATERSAPFDLVILDLTIRGGLGGAETLRRLRRRGVSAVAIASSGYSSDPVMADPTAYGFTASIPKPCGLRALQEVIQEALRGASQGGSGLQEEEGGEGLAAGTGCPSPNNGPR